jgi:hypothetical protein
MNFDHDTFELPRALQHLLGQEAAARHRPGAAQLSSSAAPASAASRWAPSRWAPGPRTRPSRPA